ncbi:F0F1 ATP synthase subunit gamma, partial [Proteus mirabilis]
GLNMHSVTTLRADRTDWSATGGEVELALVGSKAVSFCASVGGNVVGQVTGMCDDPQLSDLIGPVNILLQAYDEGRLDKLYVV